MPHHYVLHRLNVHPKYHHVKKHLSHFNKSHPKTRGGAVANRGLNHVRRDYSNANMHIVANGLRNSTDPGMHTLGAGVHRKKLHPLKFKC